MLKACIVHIITHIKINQISNLNRIFTQCMMHNELTKLESKLIKNQVFFVKIIDLKIHFDVLFKFLKSTNENSLLIKITILIYVTSNILSRYSYDIINMLLLNLNVSFLFQC